MSAFAAPPAALPGTSRRPLPLTSARSPFLAPARPALPVAPPRPRAAPAAPSMNLYEVEYSTDDLGQTTAPKKRQKLPVIPRNQMKKWARKHGCNMRTEVTMRPQRIYPEPWVCWTHIRGPAGYWVTEEQCKSKLGAVDRSMNTMYRMLMTRQGWKRWDDDPFT